MSSFLQPKLDFLDLERREVDIVTLDSLLAELLQDDPNPRVLLKLDTQGYDLEVIKGGSEFLRFVTAAVVEVSFRTLYEEMPGHVEALSLFEKLGFRAVDLSPVARHRRSGELIECDAILVRKTESAGTLDWSEIEI